MLKRERKFIRPPRPAVRPPSSANGGNRKRPPTAAGAVSRPPERERPRPATRPLQRPQPVRPMMARPPQRPQPVSRPPQARPMPPQKPQTVNRPLQRPQPVAKTSLDKAIALRDAARARQAAGKRPMTTRPPEYPDEKEKPINRPRPKPRPMGNMERHRRRNKQIKRASRTAAVTGRGNLKRPKEPKNLRPAAVSGGGLRPKPRYKPKPIRYGGKGKVDPRDYFPKGERRKNYESVVQSAKRRRRP